MPDKVEVRLDSVVDRDGNLAVLLQFEHGWILLSPDAADDLGAQIIDMADTVRRLGDGRA